MPKTATAPKRSKLTPREVAEHYGVCIDSVLAWIRSGHLKALNVSPNPASKRPRFRIDTNDLEAFERRRQVQPPAAPAPRKRKSKDATQKEYF